MRKIGTSSRIPVFPKPDPQSRDKKRRARTSHGLADGPPVHGGDQSVAEFSPSLTSVSPRPGRVRTTEALDRSLSYDAHSTLSPVSSVSVLSWSSDQPLPLPLTPSREHGRSNRSRNTGVTVSLLSPATGPTDLVARTRTGGGGSRLSSLHPDIAAVRWTESFLRREGKRCFRYNFIRYLLSQTSRPRGRRSRPTLSILANHPTSRWQIRSI